MSSSSRMSPLILRLFGPFEAEVNGTALPRLRSRKGYWLLALLALRAGREVERSWLAGTVWPDSSESEALRSLRTSLNDLRQALGDHGERLRSPSPHSLSLDLGGAAADIVAFDAAIDQGEPPALEQAISLYRGPLLEGWDEEWVFQERQAREQAYLNALESLAARSLACGELVVTERYLRRAIAVDPLRESAHRELMQALTAGGNFSGALAVYRELRLYLHREINTEPDAETTALFQQIRVEARDRAQALKQTSAAIPAAAASREASSPRPQDSSRTMQAAKAAERSPSGVAEDLEIAHVLYLDLVGYTRLPLMEQPLLLAELQQLIRGTSAFQHAEDTEDLICLPTGDGMALVFSRDPLSAVRCAMEISRGLRDYPRLQLRMGLHTGPVYRVEDINSHLNVSGSGINIAQRVMECGDSGHILLSSVVRELLEQVGDWPVHDLGECETKHGELVHLFNLQTEEIGNPVLPQRVAAYRAVQAPRSSVSSRQPSAKQRLAGGTRVVLLYRRNTQPDEQLLRSLETRLAAKGCQLFVDRHLNIGVEWAKEIERQIRSADAVVPLLSTVSVQSEMLQWEVQIASEAAREQGGKPRLLPVCIRDPGALPDSLQAIVGPLHHSTWEAPQDDERVTAELLQALENGPVARAALPPSGGAVPLDSQYYLVRPTDHLFHAAIAAGESIVLVKGPRQVGKTSLLARGLQEARNAGCRVIRTDLQMLDPADLESSEAFFKALAAWIADQLDLEVLPHEVWSPHLGVSVNFARYLRREVLAKLQTPLVWGLDEVDRLFTRDFGSQVFGLFRSWHNERALDPTGPWSGLTLAIAYATEAHLFIKEVDQSPFNVGTRLRLEDFTLEQVQDLNQRYGSPLRKPAEVERFYRLLGGHPYLVSRGLREMVAQGLNLAALAAEAEREGGLFGDHLRRLLVVLARNPDLYQVVRRMLSGEACPSETSFYQLWSAGVLAGDTAEEARLRCQLYASYLESHLS